MCLIFGSCKKFPARFGEKQSVENRFRYKSTAKESFFDLLMIQEIFSFFLKSVLARN
jgi:hypothetical protein